MQENIPVKPKKKSRWMTWLFVAINVLAIAVMAIVEFTKDDQGMPFAEVSSLLAQNWYYLLFCLGAFFMILICESGKYLLMIHSCTGKVMFRESFEVATLGRYYDYITPSGSGGQPFQMFYLKKAGLSAGVSGALPVVGFFTNQAAFLICAIVLFIARAPVLTTAPAMKVAATIGLICYSVVPILILLFSIFPGLTTGMVRGIMRFLAKVHIIKDFDRSFAKVCKYFEDYRTHLFLLSKKGAVFAMTLILSIIAQIALVSVPYFVLCACGVQNTIWVDIITLSLYVYAAVTFIPTPGNAGVAEGAFYIIFEKLSGGVLFWGTLIWRFFTYYLFIALGLVIVAITSFRAKKIGEIEVQTEDVQVTESS